VGLNAKKEKGLDGLMSSPYGITNSLLKNP